MAFGEKFAHLPGAELKSLINFTGLIRACVRHQQLVADTALHPFSAALRRPDPNAAPLTEITETKRH